jgi:hypothetical protein
VPSWYVPDETFAGRNTAQVTVYHVRTRKDVFQREIDGRAVWDLNDFDIGWSFWALFTVPDSMVAANWQKVAELVMPPAQIDFTAKLARVLSVEFSEVVATDEYEQRISDGARARQFAIVVGIDRYASADIDVLAHAVADAQAVAAMLVDRYSIPARQVTQLIGADATRQALLEAIAQLEPALAVDTLLIYFAGYGGAELDATKQAPDGYRKYLLTYDADPFELAGSALAFEEIADALRALRIQKVTFVMDASIAGPERGRTLTLAGGIAPRLAPDALDALVAGPRRSVVTAAGANETALELPDLGHGLFTHYFLAAAGDAASSGGLSFGALLQGIANRVARRAEQEGADQRPHRVGGAESGP